MSEKVILTKEQAEAIEFAKKHHMRHELIDAFMNKPNECRNWKKIYLS